MFHALFLPGIPVTQFKIKQLRSQDVFQNVLFESLTFRNKLLGNLPTDNTLCAALWIVLCIRLFLTSSSFKVNYKHPQKGHLKHFFFSFSSEQAQLAVDHLFFPYKKQLNNAAIPSPVRLQSFLQGFTTNSQSSAVPQPRAILRSTRGCTHLTHPQPPHARGHAQTSEIS